jgi:sorbitol-specific phosphotransferase system component IIBC
MVMIDMIKRIRVICLRGAMVFSVILSRAESNMNLTYVINCEGTVRCLCFDRNYILICNVKFIRPQ